MNAKLRRDDSGVNILLEYLFSLIVTVVLFSIIVLLIGNVMNKSDNIALKEEYDIISNDVANRISAFSGEVNLNDNMGLYDITAVNSKNTVFDLPEAVANKQYKVEIIYPDVSESSGHTGIVKVSSVSNSNIYSITKFQSNIEVIDNIFYSHSGMYELEYKPGPQQITVGYTT